jgi:hypothetical protein
MQPKWVIAIVLAMDALGGALGMKLIPEAYAPWGHLAVLVLGNALALFGYPLLRKAGQAVPPAVIALVVGALSLTACKATPEVRAHMALTAFAEIGSASDHAVTAYDQQLSEDAIEAAKESGSTAEARANLAEWRPKRKLARASILSYYTGLLGYQLALAQSTRDGGKVDLPALLAGLAKIASRLLDALVKFGVPNLPTLPNFGRLYDPVLEPMGRMMLSLAEVN